MSEGIVYVLTHPAMDGYVKIGRTVNLQDRLGNLFNTSVPAPFDCYYAARVADMETVEQRIHEAFGDRRVHPRREFFIADPHRILAVLEMVALENVTPTDSPEPDDAKAVDKANKDQVRRQRINFADLGIELGTELTFAKRPEVTCTVASDGPPRVEFNGRLTALSESAQEVLGTTYGVNGNLHWCYEGETLSERRERLLDDN